MNVTTTLKALRAERACIEGYNRLVRTIQGREFTEADANRDDYIRFAHSDEITLGYILESNGLDDALWALRACEQTPELQRAERLYGVWCARQVQHLITDQRGLAALDVAERFANGEATSGELDAAREAARDAAWEAARDAAREAAWDAAWEAAREAAWDAARDAARDAQKDKFIEMFCTAEVTA